MKLLIASDHAGFELKEVLKERAQDLGVEFQDLGTHSLDSVDYPDYASKLATALTQNLKSNQEPQMGILICGSGVGVSIAANRYPEIRAVLSESPETARLAREHNHANVLCLGARILTPEQAIAIVKAFLSTQPDLGDRHARRIQKMTQTQGTCS